MRYKATDVARFVVNFAHEEGKPVTNLKLKYILYYLQGFSYLVFDEELFEDDLKAWAYGPTVKEVYTNFSMFGSDIIPAYNDILDLIFMKPKEIEDYRSMFKRNIVYFLEANLKNLLEYSTEELLKSVLKDSTPWGKNYIEGKKKLIPKEDIKEYFVRIVNEKNEQWKHKPL